MAMLSIAHIVQKLVAVVYILACQAMLMLFAVTKRRNGKLWKRTNSTQQAKVDMRKAARSTVGRDVGVHILPGLNIGD
jgi:hypothetical protein